MKIRGFIYVAALLLGILTLAGCEDKRRTLAISKIKAASKLATTEVTLSKMIFATQERTFLGIIKLNDATFGARTKATVKAGIDLDELKSTDVKIEGGVITIELPTVKVLDFKYPFTSYEIDFSITENSFGNSITIEEHEELYRNAELQIRKLLPLMGIKEATERNTRKLVENLLYKLGYTEVNISFKKGDFIEANSLTPEDLKLKK